ncbi:MAG: EAL domain-containing protein [Burkholderiaceae bacterium]|nr:EAL domain-containing protein [Burkholderiaceae bacterium]
MVVRASLERNARSQIAQTLDTAEKVWHRLLEQNAERLRQAATLLASDQRLGAAVQEGDLPAIQSILDTHGKHMGATVTALLDNNVGLRAVHTGPGMGGLQAALVPALPGLLSVPQQGSTVAIVAGLPYQFVMVPLKMPVAMGWVLIGLPISQAWADEMRQLLSVQVALRLRDAAHGAWTVPISTLSLDALDTLRQPIGMVTELHSAGHLLLARTGTLSSVGGQVQVVLLHPVDAVLASSLQLQALLWIVTGTGALLFAVGMGLMSRRVLVPLRSLVLGTQRLARGEYEIPVEHTQRSDEWGVLARAFDHMRTSIAEQHTEIRHLAYWDRLTGLPNRERFRDILLQAITAHASHADRAAPLAVITLDLDRFKHVNDVLGYAFGDQLLQAVAERLRQQVSADNDVVARLGGNEFALLLGSADKAAALEVARRIADSLESPMAFGDQTVDLSAGIGIACWPVDADNVDTLLGHSEIAMYAAKRRLNGPQLYDAALDSSSTQTLSLLTELRRAVEHNELRLYLQPKVALQGQLGVTAESLLRWQHPVRGLVPPGEFIPFAEQTGFVRQLTLWMFDTAARLLSDARAQDMGLRVSVNLSTRDLLDPDLSVRLGTMLERHGVRAESFCLEITESAIMDDPQRAEAMLNRLSQQGFKLSIDDFGTGYSSLGYLKRLPVDELKIDRSFVMGMEGDENDATIVRSTIDLAHNLGLSVVAEGVENAAILERLRALACDEAQGYHISRPMPIEAFFAWQAQQV